jgi:high-affinity iron transporter
VLPTFVIGLREGLEASLIVGIIAAFLIKRNRRRELRLMWVGVAAATALCLVVAGAAEVLGRDLPERQREGLTAILSLAAVAMVTYMIVWMHKHARELKSSVERDAELALSGSAWALIMMAFLAVIREGLETAVFLLAVFKASSRPTAAAAGAFLGLGAAVALGYAIYKGGVHLNLARFFRITGFVLVLVAAGLLASAVEAATNAGWINVLGGSAVNLRWMVSPTTVWGSLLTGMFGVRPEPSWAEVTVWLCYAVPMSIYVLWPNKSQKTPNAPVEAAGGAPQRAKTT